MSRVGAVQLDALALALSERDWQVLSALASHRLMSTDQQRRLVFTGYDSGQVAERMAQLSLKRLHAQVGAIAHLERRIGGVRAGSGSFVWHLTSVGRRLLGTDFAPSGLVDRTGTDRLPKVAVVEPSLRTVRHSLAVSEVAVRLSEAGSAGKLEVLTLEPEPLCWRNYLGVGGERLSLKPDLFAITATTGSQWQDHWFVEVDMATESLATIRRKSAAYQAYYRSGREQTERGVFPRVLWLTPDENRAEAITEALRNGHGGGLHLSTPVDDLIKVVTDDDTKESRGGLT